MMKKVTLVLVAVMLLLVFMTAGMVQAQNPLHCTVAYWFRGEMEGTRFLAWEGTISGDIEGTIKWYALGDMEVAGQTSHYFSSWEIMQGDDLILAGEDGGSTTVRHGKNSVWRANGTITYAGEGYEEWIGRRTHQGGHFEWADLSIGLPDVGTGTFRAN